MQLSVSTRSANSYGGNTTYSLVGQYLQTGLSEYGSALSAIEITACFRGGAVGHHSLQTSYDKYHATYLSSLPKMRFIRKKAKGELQYETAVVDADFLKRYGFLSVEIFSEVLREIAGILHLIDSRIKATDDFALARFHQDVADVVAAAPQSDDDLRGLKVQIDTAEKNRRAAMDPWDKLGIEDWDQFHPAARSLLNDPFFWDCVNDYAPHGNDTGADLLADFKKWNKRHSSDFAFNMATSLLKRWGIPPIDYCVTSEAGVVRLMENDGITLHVTDEAMIAVAFASVKYRGWCDEPTVEYALDAIERQRIAAGVAKQQSKDVTEWLGALDTMSAVLRRVPNQPVGDPKT